MAPSIHSRPRGSLCALVACAALSAACAILATGCTSKMKSTLGGGGGGPTPQATIQIVQGAFNKNMMAFSPDTVTVHVNDVVRMHNGDSITHDIEAFTPGGPSWGNLGAGASADVQPTATGTFTYVCAIGGHTMTGTLIVAP